MEAVPEPKASLIFTMRSFLPIPAGKDTWGFQDGAWQALLAAHGTTSIIEGCISTRSARLHAGCWNRRRCVLHGSSSWGQCSKMYSLSSKAVAQLQRWQFLASHV